MAGSQTAPATGDPGTAPATLSRSAATGAAPTLAPAPQALGSAALVRNQTQASECF